MRLLRPTVVLTLLLLAPFSLVAPTAEADGSSAAQLDASQFESGSSGPNRMTSRPLLEGEIRSLQVYNLPDACNEHGCKTFLLFRPGATSPGAVAQSYPLNETSYAVTFPNVNYTPAGVWSVRDDAGVQAASFLVRSAWYFDNMEFGTAGWTATGLWHLTTDHANTTVTSWYHGVENGAGRGDNTYDTGGRNVGDLISGPLDLSWVPPGARLTFWQSFHGEGCPFEHPAVDVSTTGPTGPWTRVYEYCGGTSYEGPVDVDLAAYQGSVVHLRFAWDTIDDGVNGFEGWYVDDVLISVAPPAPGDLQAVAAAPVLSPVRTGQNATFKASFVNGGSTPVPPFLVRFLVDGALVSETSHGSLLPGESAEVTSDAWTATEGTHTLTVLADPDNLVEELNENNNAATMTFDALAPAELPDLALSAMPVGVAREGDLLVFRANLTNGGKAVARNVSVSFVLETGEVVGRRTVDAIGERGIVTIESDGWIAKPGRHTITVVADGESLIEESNEENNRVSTTFLVTPHPRSPDLAVRILEVRKATLRTDAGSLPLSPVPRIDIDVELCNAGEVVLDAASASLSAETQRIDGEAGTASLGNVSVGSLAPAECRTVTYRWDAVGYMGDVTLVAEAAAPEGDADSGNDRDTEETFLYVGGAGGFSLGSAVLP